MKTQTLKNCLICLFVVSLLAVAANAARADFVSDDKCLTFTTDPKNYQPGVYGTDWNFTEVKPYTYGKGWTEWKFTVANNNGELTSSPLKATGFNGNGSSNNVVGKVNDGGTATIKHNDANAFSMTFGSVDGFSTAFVDSFFISIGPFSSWSAALAFNMTISYWDADGVLKTATPSGQFDVNGGFLGFMLSEGAFLQEVVFQSVGTKNNGYTIYDMGFGEIPGPPIPPTPPIIPPTATPEPATMLIFGIGAMGMGAVVLRRKLQK